jgi:tRNA 2-thiocytidine biosynthesis protein TtcA
MLAENLTHRALKPPKAIMRLVGRAIADFDMIREGDRIMLGLSGGKDSLCLLHILQPSLAGLGIPYFFESQAIEKQAKEHMINDSFCSFCSRIKRGIMYTTLRREGYNVLALAQHLDDLAESFLMSAFHGGQLRTMKANYLNKDGDVRIIRPLVYVRERQTRDFAREAELPVVPDSCPACFGMPTQREHMKALLAKEESHNKYLFRSLLQAMRPLISKNSAE